MRKTQVHRRVLAYIQVRRAEEVGIPALLLGQIRYSYQRALVQAVEGLGLGTPDSLLFRLSDLN